MGAIGSKEQLGQLRGQENRGLGGFRVATHHWDDFLLDKSREGNQLKEESKVKLFFERQLANRSICETEARHSTAWRQGGSYRGDQEANGNGLLRAGHDDERCGDLVARIRMTKMSVRVSAKPKVVGTGPLRDEQVEVESAI